MAAVRAKFKCYEITRMARNVYGPDGQPEKREGRTIRLSAEGARRSASVMSRASFANRPPPF